MPGSGSEKAVAEKERAAISLVSHLQLERDKILTELDGLTKDMNTVYSVLEVKDRIQKITQQLDHICAYAGIDHETKAGRDYFKAQFRFTALLNKRAFFPPYVNLVINDLADAVRVCVAQKASRRENVQIDSIENALEHTEMIAHQTAIEYWPDEKKKVKPKSESEEDVAQ